MGTINKFEDLGIWKHSRVICQDIYSVITNGTLAKDWALRDQMNKSSGSIMDNIAEGFGRDGRNEFLQFLSFSKSSASELRSQLYRALDRGHVSAELFDGLSRRILDQEHMTAGFMKYLRNSGIRGLKYKTNGDFKK